MTWVTTLRFLSRVSLLGAVACGGAVRAPVSLAVAEAAGAPFHILESARSEHVTFTRLASVAASADVVFFGEQHDDPTTHGVELAVLAALGERRADVLLSLEMFERDVQAVLDDYLAGRVSEAEFLARSRPWERYTTDYRPLVELARVRGWRVVASNVPRRIASEVSRRGLGVLDSLGASDRAFVARDIACPLDAYYRRFAQQMQSHMGVTGGDTVAANASLLRYYEAQCIKDETMAESIAEALRSSGGGAIVLHITGSFHSDYGQGTVERVRRRLPRARPIVLSATPSADPALAADAAGREDGVRADFVVFTRRSPAGGAPRP